MSSELQTKWAAGVRSELHFWSRWLEERGGRWPEDYHARLDPNTPFNKDVEKHFRFSAGQVINLLDVGAGPITSLGYKSDSYRIAITAVDALADDYNRLLQDAEIVPPVQTKQCAGEDLRSHFSNTRFQVCHSRNALDHFVDPRNVISAMSELLVPGGLLYVDVYKNEGQRQGYEGLHNWNFDKDESSNLVLWRGDERHNISAMLAAAGECRVADLGHRLKLIFYRANEAT